MSDLGAETGRETNEEEKTGHRRYREGHISGLLRPRLLKGVEDKADPREPVPEEGPEVRKTACCEVMDSRRERCKGGLDQTGHVLLQQ